MRGNNRLNGCESLERREVFTGLSMGGLLGVGGLAAGVAPTTDGDANTAIYSDGTDPIVNTDLVFQNDNGWDIPTCHVNNK